MNVTIMQEDLKQILKEYLERKLNKIIRIDEYEDGEFYTFEVLV